MTSRISEAVQDRIQHIFYREISDRFYLTPVKATLNLRSIVTGQGLPSAGNHPQRTQVNTLWVYTPQEHTILNQWALVFLVSSGCTALMIIKDILIYRQPGTLMNIIWPLTGLYLPFIGWLAWWYLRRIPRYRIKSALLDNAQITTLQRMANSIFIATAMTATACILAEAITLPIITLMNYLKIPLLIWQQAAISLLISLLLMLVFHFFTLPQHEKKSSWHKLSLAFKRSAFPL